MKRGSWHQFGSNSQKLALEQLENGAGVGVIMSSRDLAPAKAAEYAPQYRSHGAEVMIDQQFYVPGADVGKLGEHPISRFRESVSELHRISDLDLTSLQAELHRVNQNLNCDAVLAPAVVYESARHEIVELNARLFGAAKAVGDSLGVPTIGTLVVGAGATGSDVGVSEVLDAATSLDADGWYYAYEFAEPRIPQNEGNIVRWAKAGLTLAASTKPVLSAFAGPLSLLAPAFGASAVGIGHSQNLWQFDRSRWHPAQGRGGGGDAPPRLFSATLWGTIVYPDEIALLQPQMAATVVTPSQFSAEVTAKPPFLPWPRWSSHKHLVNVLCRGAQFLLDMKDPRKAAGEAVTVLSNAIQLHDQISSAGVVLKDDTAGYQQAWVSALARVLTECADDFDFLELASE